MWLVQYGKQIITGMTNFNNSGKVELYGQVWSILYCIILSSNHQWLGPLLHCIAIMTIKLYLKL